MIKEIIIDSHVFRVSDDGKIYNENNKEYNQHLHTSGYYVISLKTNKKSKNYSVHRLVATAFLDNTLFNNENLHVHHKDFDKTNNVLSNLQILTSGEHQNIHHKIYPISKICVVCGKEFYPNPTKRKRAHVCSNECKIKLDKINAAKRKRPINQYTKNGSFLKRFDSVKDIQSVLGFSGGNIVKACKSKSHYAYGFLWRYENE